MTKIGLREANLHFSKYLKMVKNGKEVILTERGEPIAIIKPIPQEEGEKEYQRIKVLEEEGLLKRSKRGRLPLHKLIIISGKPISQVVIEEREKGY